jgi:hypothetical protein
MFHEEINNGPSKKNRDRLDEDTQGTNLIQIGRRF